MALDIDIIDIVAIDDKAPAYTNKQVAVGAELFPNHILHLSELEREHSRLVVGLHQVAVIPVRRDKHNLVGRNTHQVSRCGYDQILLQHDEAKVATSWDCKDRLFVEMYEIGLKMYEINRFPHNKKIPAEARIFKNQKPKFMKPFTCDCFHSHRS